MSKAPLSPSDRNRIALQHSDADGVPRLAEVRDLASRLQFAPQDGRIWLDEQRMLLLHQHSFADWRKAMQEALGEEQTQALLMKLGYMTGARDAELARQVRSQRSLKEMFAAGPQLHALEGFAAVEPVRIDVDVERGFHYVEQLWHDSAEAAAHLEAHGLSEHPVCWMQLGYASGFNSAFFGRPIVFREVECVGRGDAHCRIIGKPAEEWEDANAHEHAMAPGDLLAQQAAQVPEWRRVDGSRIGPHDRDYMVGSSAAFITACHQLQKVARTQATVLLLGESGVGKERFAAMLHQLSKRANQAFVALNCAAIPENLLEAELFGVERGAYTGARESRKGRFERADGGTLFLDEIGTLNEAAQAKLLRALQEREIERVGGSSARAVDVRVVAATNADLESAVKQGKFRADLYYRLNVFPIVIAPLRERRDDIPALVHHFVQQMTELHEKAVGGFTHRAIASLLNYSYPGNVRELQNLIERAVILVPDGGLIDRPHLFQSGTAEHEALLAVDASGAILPAAMTRTTAAPDDALVQSLAEQTLSAAIPLATLELATMRQAVREAEGNLSMAARRLGVSRAQLAYRLEKGEP